MSNVHDVQASLKAVPELTVTSETFEAGAALPNAQVSGVMGAGGEDRSPQLSWSGAPEGTKSFVVTAYDPDAPTGSGFWHWVVANIPADVTSLPEGAMVADKIEADELQDALVLKNDAGMPGFVGAAPPAGHGPHRYVFTVHAVDVEKLEDVGGDATPAFLGFNLFFHGIARGSVEAVFEAK